VDQTPKKRQKSRYEARLQALKRSATKAKARVKGGSDTSSSGSENVFN
jgi:hypothetical protein